ncbi:carboxylating nicotinate-nucleotide diphosphorylase [Sediminibacillus halophilus]|uniref:Probable nicotinate-nucleotide pyrophosphorylase [carboxylating] n=1 Tax=Sediminibacillus halophilus TaxID=482461 RepID=A0A1G9YPN5_9BACI|nr:carboxylating nicotinate-nucleotide diphosphorylase [Sediminibacillus halophilus]SDN11044.1 nicotinate-nucleotide pyrophosphorylase (carboxylating) [Sediminibacillus halophilus]
MNNLKLQELLRQFYLEDIGDQDLTSTAIFPIHQTGTGTFIAKQRGILAGLSIIAEAYRLFDPSIRVKLLKRDGQSVLPGEKIAEVEGPVRHLLTGERVILNLLQRMSGIATKTRQSVDALGSRHTKICDTRKTTPGLRMLEKYAVSCGGGKNHRFGLYDGIMIKDNHIAFCGSITKAVQAARSHSGHMVKLEVETENEEQVIEAVEAGVDVIMFDNRSPEEVAAFVQYVPKGIVTEASGGITEDRLAAYRDTGVDYISLGYLTHSIHALDISMIVKNQSIGGSIDENDGCTSAHPKASVARNI